MNTSGYISLSGYFGISPQKFAELGILDAPIVSDAPLFIDPKLLAKSSYSVFNTDARNVYVNFYAKLYKDVVNIASLTDETLRSRAIASLAQRLKSKEPVGLCLGYSKKSNRGNGVGSKIADKIVSSALKIVDIGSKKPDMFSLLFLLERGIAGDFISDLTANIIKKQLLEFTQGVSKELGITTSPYRIDGDTYMLPKHPFDNTYLLFVPYDIVNRLPTENDLDSVLSTLFNMHVDSNDEIRYRVNTDISSILANAAENKLSVGEQKERIKDYIYKNPGAADVLIDAINNTEPTHIDIRNDPEGVNISAQLPLLLSTITPKFNAHSDQLGAIDDVIKSFKFYIDHDDSVKRNMLYDASGSNKHEKAWQDAFLTFSTFYLKKQNIDVTPEYNTGCGVVDFKLSYGEDFKVLIELKLSSNTKYRDGLEKQLEAYKNATTNVKKSYFIFIDLEKDPNKSKEKIEKLQQIKKRYGLDTEIIIINGLLHPSASKL